MEARNDNRLKDELSILIKQVATLPPEPISLGLAVRIEMLFSHILLQRLLADVQKDYMAAGQLLKFLRERWQMLSHTAALGPYSRNTTINRACASTARCFSGFSTDLILREILNFEETCKEKEKEILQSEKEKLVDVIQAKSVGTQLPANELTDNGNLKIYEYICHSVFANQTIEKAMSLVPKSEEHIKTDSWRTLLDGIMQFVPDRKTFIKILCAQVEYKDWRFFISKIQHFDLYHLILGINADGLLRTHRQKPVDQQGNNEFDLELLAAGNELLQRKRSYYVGKAGEVFKGMIEADHGCETDEEVSALAFCLLETYRRIREKLDDYSSMASEALSWLTPVCTKEDKVEACDCAMRFILTGKSFTKENLTAYAAAENQAGRLKQPAYDKFKLATSQGALKSLLDAMFEVQKKVVRLSPQPT